MSRPMQSQSRVPASTPVDRTRFELALEASGMGVWEWRIADNRVFWSADVERIHGIAVGSFDGTLEMQRKDVHPEDRETVLAQQQRTLTQRTPHHLTYRIIRPDGEVRWLESHGKLLVDERGAPDRLIGVVRDITERRDAETARVRSLASDVARAEAERQKERLSAIFESITDSFIVLDDDLRIAQANKAALKLAKKPASLLVGKKLAELPHTQGPNVDKGLQRALHDQKAQIVEDYIASMDRWFETSIFPLDHGLSVYSRDITLRRRAVELTTRLARHDALRADVGLALSEQRDLREMLVSCCQAMVRHLGVAFARCWTVDEAGSTLLLQASAGMYTHTDGPHRAVPIGKFKIGLIASEREPHMTNDVQNDPRVGNPEWAKREKMVAFAGYPMIVDDELVGVLAMFSRSQIPDDTMSALAGITDTIAQGIVRWRTERELEDRMQDLARSNADLEQFAYVASHDLQEPLRMIASYNQLLARRYKGKLGEDADEFIGYTVEGVTRMQRLINDLLAYSRVGTRSKEPVEVDLEKLLAPTLANLERAIIEAGAEITHDPLPTVIGDEGQLAQLFQNLIGNAIKFHGAEPPRIHIGACADAAGWKLWVKDNGIGIDPQYFERIFVIFQRLHAREDYPGTGIGLSICKKIVERHGGKIWV
ncbi:MAG: PAS domain-containing protein, partial [Deltaproteobacteria bacterium]|nr:PAS domain-containing protein [Deltaproteobacteria bacterium]